MKNAQALKILKKQVECLEQGKEIVCKLNPLKIAVSALEKQIPKKIVKREHDFSIQGFLCKHSLFHCPHCNFVFGEVRQNDNAPHCENCGQALDWSDVE